MKDVKPRGRPRAFDRDAALEAATDCFWRLGYDATSVRELATAMGISQPSLYGAFGDKAALYREALQAYQVRFSLLDMTPLTAAASLEDGLHALLGSLAKRCTRYKRGCFWLSGTIANLPEQRELVLHHRSRRKNYEATLSVALRHWLDFDTAHRATRVLIMGMRGYSEMAEDGHAAGYLEDAAKTLVRSVVELQPKP